jgi:hypothetical protein
MSFGRHMALAAITLAAACACAQRGAHPEASVSIEGSDPRARQLIQSVVRSELSAAEHDHSVWTYRDRDRTAEKDALYQVVDTPYGGVRRMIEIEGRACGPELVQKENARIAEFVHDTAAQERQHKAGLHDDEQARQMLLMLPNAFIWTIKGESGDQITLGFRPDDNFHPPNMEARVMGTMAGELIIAKTDNRIRTLRGALSDDVKIGFGMLGKLRHGGTFDVERREIAPHIWQITETHVHIEGRALLFKTIGQQEDEVKSEWKPSTAKTLEEAAKQLGAN